MTAHPDPLDRLIASADPVPPTDPAFGSDVDPVLDEVWEQLRPELSTATPSRRRVRRLVPTTLGIAAVAALTAAAPFIATHTGQPNPPEEVAAGGPGENYRLNGSDFATSLAALSTDIPFPDQVSRATVESNLVAQALRDGDTRESTGALRAELARGAICAWERTWQDAEGAAGLVRRLDSLLVAVTPGMRRSLCPPHSASADDRTSSARASPAA